MAIIPLIFLISLVVIIVGLAFFTKKRSKPKGADKGNTIEHDSYRERPGRAY